MTFLHIYHHSMVLMLSWGILRAYPGKNKYRNNKFMIFSSPSPSPSITIIWGVHLSHQHSFKLIFIYTGHLHISLYPIKPIFFILLILSSLLHKFYLPILLLLSLTSLNALAICYFIYYQTDSYTTYLISSSFITPLVHFSILIAATLIFYFIFVSATQYSDPL